MRLNRIALLLAVPTLASFTQNRGFCLAGFVQERALPAGTLGDTCAAGR